MKRFWVALAAAAVFAADKKTPEIDQATQVEILADQVALKDAQIAALPYVQAVQKAAGDAKVSMVRGVKQCNPGVDVEKDAKAATMEPAVDGHKVVCRAKPVEPKEDAAPKAAK